MLKPSRRALAVGFASVLMGCSAPAFEGLQPRDPDAEPANADAVHDVVASDYAAHVDLLALGYGDGRFELRSPAPRHVLSSGKHEATILNLALSPDGRMLATADAAGNIAVSEIESGSYGVLPKLAHFADGVDAVGLAWDAQGKRLAIVAGVDVRVLEPDSGNSKDSSLSKPANAVVFSPDGTRLIVAGRQLSILDLPGLNETSVSRPPRPPAAKGMGNVLDVRFSPDGGWLGVLYTDSVVLSNERNGVVQVAPLAEVAPVGLRFASDGRVAIFGRNALYVGPPSTADIPAGLRKTSGALWDVEFRQDGGLMFLADAADVELASVLE